MSSPRHSLPSQALYESTCHDSCLQPVHRAQKRAADIHDFESIELHNYSIYILKMNVHPTQNKRAKGCERLFRHGLSQGRRVVPLRTGTCGLE